MERPRCSACHCIETPEGSTEFFKPIDPPFCWFFALATVLQDESAPAPPDRDLADRMLRHQRPDLAAASE